MTAMDLSGLLVLGAAAIICAGELALSGWVWALPPSDPCRERPSSLPQEREVRE
jgi:hypothetical protein